MLSGVNSDIPSFHNDCAGCTFVENVIDIVMPRETRAGVNYRPIDWGVFQWLVGEGIHFSMPSSVRIVTM